MEAFRNPPPEQPEAPHEYRVVTGRQGSPISWINVLAGIWEFFAPWIWGYSRFTTPLANDLILGALIFFAAIASVSSRYRAGAWWNLLFGVWLIIAPFVLGYSGIGSAESNDVGVGIIVAVVALFAALSRPSATLS